MIRSCEYNPLSQLHTVAHGAVVQVLCLDGYIHTLTVTHGPERGHGATLSVELPPLAALWRYA